MCLPIQLVRRNVSRDLDNHCVVCLNISYSRSFSCCGAKCKTCALCLARVSTVVSYEEFLLQKGNSERNREMEVLIFCWLTRWLQLENSFFVFGCAYAFYYVLYVISIVSFWSTRTNKKESDGSTMIQNINIIQFHMRFALNNTIPVFLSVL